mmetsp:Transcript_149604/g.261460  ORF Transcript_149604/g.261460 Transcript_149604/m.261460 type:complete len:86 (+) Transcript_149604:244-501(+)
MVADSGCYPEWCNCRSWDLIPHTKRRRQSLGQMVANVQAHVNLILESSTFVFSRSAQQFCRILGNTPDIPPWYVCDMHHEVARGS